MAPALTEASNPQTFHHHTQGRSQPTCSTSPPTHLPPTTHLLQYGGLKEPHNCADIHLAAALSNGDLGNNPPASGLGCGPGGLHPLSPPATQMDPQRGHTPIEIEPTPAMGQDTALGSMGHSTAHPHPETMGQNTALPQQVRPQQIMGTTRPLQIIGLDAIRPQETMGTPHPQQVLPYHPPQQVQPSHPQQVQPSHPLQSLGQDMAHPQQVHPSQHPHQVHPSHPQQVHPHPQVHPQSQVHSQQTMSQNTSHPQQTMGEYTSHPQQVHPHPQIPSQQVPPHPQIPPQQVPLQEAMVKSKPGTQDGDILALIGRDFANMNEIIDTLTKLATDNPDALTAALNLPVEPQHPPPVPLEEAPPEVPKEERARVLVEELGRRQWLLERRQARLQRRLRRVTARGLSATVSGQLRDLLSHGHTTLTLQRQDALSQLIGPSGASGESSPVTPDVVDTLKADTMKAMSTSALVSLVRRVEASQGLARLSAVSSKSVRTAVPQPQPSPAPAPALPELTRAEVSAVAAEMTAATHAHTHHDSDATETSSGGESCDEFEGFSSVNTAFSPVGDRALYRYQKCRSWVASRWTWLQAQIADLEYRILQQHKIYTHVRNTKGNVQVEEDTNRWRGPAPRDPAHLDTHDPALTCLVTPLTVNGYHNRGDDGTAGSDAPFGGARLRKDVLAPGDSNCVSARTQGVRVVKRRRLVRAGAGLCAGTRRNNGGGNNNGGGKIPAVQCKCVPPLTCVLCTRIAGPTQSVPPPDPYTQPHSERYARVDPTYHPVLSQHNDISLSERFDGMLKTTDWQRQILTAKSIPSLPIRQQPNNDKKKKKDKERKREYKKHKKEGKGRITLKLKRSVFTGELVRDGDVKRKKPTTPQEPLLPAAKKARGSVSGSVDDDDDVSSLYGSINSSPSASPAPIDRSALRRNTISAASHKNKQSQRDSSSSYDIDNIVIPYSMAASTRVEKLEYKEIPTPKWRLVPLIPNNIHRNSSHVDQFEEDISEEAFAARHGRSEELERKKFLQYLHMQVTSRSSRSRRTDSSGTNTPDHALSPRGVDVTIDNISPLATPPTTPHPPTHNEDSNQSLTNLPPLTPTLYDPINTQQNTLDTPQNTKNTQENTVNTPQNNADTPQNTVNTPQNNADNTPQNTVNTPQNAVDTPQNTVNTPQNTVNTVNTPQNNADTPQNTVNTQLNIQNTADVTNSTLSSQSTSINTPQNTANTPQNTVNTANTQLNTANTPQNVCSVNHSSSLTCSKSGTLSMSSSNVGSLSNVGPSKTVALSNSASNLGARSNAVSNLGAPSCASKSGALPNSSSNVGPILSNAGARSNAISNLGAPNSSNISKSGVINISNVPSKTPILSNSGALSKSNVPSLSNLGSLSKPGPLSNNLNSNAILTKIVTQSKISNASSASIISTLLTGKQTNIQTNTQTNKPTNTQTNKQILTHKPTVQTNAKILTHKTTNVHTDSQTNTNKQILTHIPSQTNKQILTHIPSQTNTQTNLQTNVKTHRQTGIPTSTILTHIPLQTHSQTNPNSVYHPNVGAPSLGGVAARRIRTLSTSSNTKLRILPPDDAASDRLEGISPYEQRVFPLKDSEYMLMTRDIDDDDDDDDDGGNVGVSGNDGPLSPPMDPSNDINEESGRSSPVSELTDSAPEDDGQYYDDMVAPKWTISGLKDATTGQCILQIHKTHTLES